MKKNRFRFTRQELGLFDITMGKIIAQNLKEFKKIYVTVPGRMCGEFGELPFPKAKKRWDKLLDKIIWSFTEVSNGYANEPAYFPSMGKRSKENKRYWKKVNRGIYLFADYYRDLSSY